MTIPSSSPKVEGFAIAKLLSDTRYRARTLQLIAAGLLLIFLGWLISNTLSNLSTLGKPLSFTFLWEKAGYDINQRLISYSADDSHFRAALTGLVNTLIVAVLGCIAATVLGLFIGIARLSANEGLARLARVYVEIFRNVPLLLWLLLIFALITETLPPPDAFRGDAPVASMMLSNSIAVTNRGIFIPHVSFHASNPSLVFFLMTAGLILFSFIAIRLARTKQARTGKRPFVGLPLVCVWLAVFAMVLAWASPEVTYPVLKGFNFRGGLHIRTSLVALWLALSLYTAAFIAEIVRSGILAVSKGQKEAAAALGLGSGQTMRLIVLPQALRVIIPPMISNYLNLTKNSSLAIAVGYMDITGTLMGITLNQTGRELETVILGMSFYLLISVSIAIVLNRYNTRVQLRER